MLKDIIVDQLVFSTVKIVCDDVAAGTGFFVSHKINEKTEMVHIVTNRHVTNGYKAARMLFPTVKENGEPDVVNKIEVEYPDLQSSCIYHKDSNIDICLIDINPSILGTIYYRAIPEEMFVVKQNSSELKTIENILMIGYPNSLMDNINCRPIARSGITATDIKIDYNGKPIFVIDAACWPGSSGSPVFIKKEGLAQEKKENSISIGIVPSYYFAGLLSAGPTVTVDGEITVKEVPTSLSPIIQTDIMINLGYVIKAEKLIEIFDEFRIK